MTFNSGSDFSAGIDEMKWHTLFPHMIETNDAYFYGYLHAELTLGIP